MKKIVVIAVLFITMTGLLYKRSLHSMKRTYEGEVSQPSSKEARTMVTLMSSDGKEFQLDRKVAEQSEFIKTMIAETNEGAEGRLPIPKLSGDMLGNIIIFLEKLPYTTNVDNLVIEKCATLADAQILLLADASMYLFIEPLTNALMRLYIFKQFQVNRNVSVDEIKQTVNHLLLRAVIDEQYEYVAKSVGFRVLYPMKNMYRNDSKKHELDFEQQNIRSLYGLVYIPNKES